MSKHNYSKYSSNKPANVYVDEDVVENVVTDEVVEETIAETVAVVEETVETVTLPKTVTGTVVNCTKLNVRATPEATGNIVCVLDGKSEVAIDTAKSNNEWVSVCTATGVEGYCMRKFVEATL